MARIITTVFVVCLFALTGCSGLTHASTQTTLTATIDVNLSTSMSENGLSLFVSLDSTTYKLGQEVIIGIDETNTLEKTNNVSAAEKWPLAGLSVSPCGTLNYPFGIAIFQGYYTSGNITSATPLKLYNPNSIYSCPMILSEINTYKFQPSSDIAAIFQTSNTNPVITEKMNTEVQATGYWTDNPPLNLTNFAPGVYTVVGGDEWGSLVIVYFTVSNTSIVTTTSSATVTAAATTSSQQPVDIVSVLGPLQPINPGGPIVEITLKNIAAEPIISLTAIFTNLGPRDFVFNFAVSNSNPLLSGTSISDSLTLIGAGFSSNVSYPMTITGTLQNGETFFYEKQVKIAEH